MKRFIALAVGLLSVLGTRVLAQTPPVLPCGNLPGCGGGGAATNVIADTVLPELSTILLRITAGGAVIFVIIAGYQMMWARGDDGKIATAKWGVMNAMMGLALAIVSQIIVSGVITEPSLINAQNEVDVLVGIREILLAIMNGFFLVIIAYGGLRMLIAQGKPDDFKKGQSTVTWAIVGAIVVNLAGALIMAVSTLFGV